MKRLPSCPAKVIERCWGGCRPDISLHLIVLKPACPVGSSKLTIIASTERLHNVDPALRRAGRFDKEVAVGLSNQKVLWSCPLICLNPTARWIISSQCLANMCPVKSNTHVAKLLPIVLLRRHLLWYSDANGHSQWLEDCTLSLKVRGVQVHTTSSGPKTVSKKAPFYGATSHASCPGEAKSDNVCFPLFVYPNV